MGWRIIEGCRDDNCPRLFVDDEAALVYVQGDVVTTPGIPAPGPGEGLVRMTTEAFEALLDIYSRES